MAKLNETTPKRYGAEAAAPPRPHPIQDDRLGPARGDRPGAAHQRGVLDAVRAFDLGVTQGGRRGWIVPRKTGISVGQNPVPRWR